MSNPPRDPAADFTAIYARTAARIYLYAARHVGPDHADDVVSETFTVAWRRLDDVPADDATLPWLLVVARNVIANHRRREGRKDRLARDAEVVSRLDTVTADVAVDIAERHALIGALAELSEREREAVLLVGWDGLAGADAAKVAGCSPGAFNVRLHRARQRLQRSTSTSAAPDPGTRRTALAPEATP